MTPSDALMPKARDFVSDVSSALIAATADADGEGAPFSPKTLEGDVISEAYQICCSFIDADGRHTDNELWALAGTFGRLRGDTQLAGATPDTLRSAGVATGQADWLRTPSTLLDILATADRRDGTTGAQAYYRRAMDLVHLIAALDQATTREELEVISAFRAMLLDHIRTRGNVEPTPSAPGAAQPTGDISPMGSGADRAGSSPPPNSRPPNSPPPNSPPPKRPLEDVLAELDELLGLVDVKTEVRLIGDLIAVQKMRADAGLTPIETSLHMVFTGNPGTGKTTVARLLAQIYHSLGALDSGQLVETDRSSLVAGYVGQTATLVKDRFDEADGGLLFIDEAYTLVRGGESDFGKEAIDSIVKEMEDRRDSTALVVAGYPEEMADFIGANPGLRSRFPTTIHFPDYSTDELVGIFEIIAGKSQYRLSNGGREALVERLDRMDRGPGFGNGRVARNMFEAAVRRHATRVVNAEDKDAELLSMLTAADVGAPAP